MKYIDAEKLYEKVDALLGQYAKAENKMKDDVELSLFYHGKMQMCSDILDIIESLQQEQAEVDLEKEVKSYIKDSFTITDEVAQIPEEDRMYSMGQDDMVAFAKHFYELGLKARMEE